MPTDNFVQVPPNSTGSKLRTFENTVNSQVVETEVVADVYNGGEILADQNGANGVLTFTFSAAVHMAWVLSRGGVSRADPFGGTPTASLGIYCDDGIPTPITVTTSSIKIYAPTGATVTAYGYRY